MLSASVAHVVYFLLNLSISPELLLLLIPFQVSIILISHRFLTLHLSVDPYLNRGLNVFQRLALFSQFFTVFGGIMFQYLKTLDKVLEKAETPDDRNQRNIIAYLIFILNLFAIAVYPIYQLFTQISGFGTQSFRTSDFLLLPHVILSMFQRVLSKLSFFQSDEERKRIEKETKRNETEKRINDAFDDFSKRGRDKESARRLLESLGQIWRHPGLSAPETRSLFLFSIPFPLLSLSISLYRSHTLSRSVSLAHIYT
jgi:hypothetical protein